MSINHRKKGIVYMAQIEDQLKTALKLSLNVIIVSESDCIVGKIARVFGDTVVVASVASPVHVHVKFDEIESVKGITFFDI